MYLFEVLPYSPFVIITKVKNMEEAEEVMRNESQYILVNKKQLKGIVDNMKGGIVDKRK